MIDSPLTQVRQACRAVVGRARLVAIDNVRLAAYVQAVTPEQLALPELDPRCHWLGRGGETATFMLMLEAINFGSGYFVDLAPYQGLTGYFAVAGALRDHFERAGVPSAEALTGWSWRECARIFGQDPDHPPARELMTAFAEALGELGAHVGDRYGGHFEGLVEAAGGSAAALVARLIEMPGFADIAEHDGQPVPILKRAQLTAADLSLALGGEGLGRFHDLDHLTCFADDQVPHVLHSDGILVYRPELERAITRGELLAPGSAAEVEIRAATIEVVERIVAALAQAGRPSCAMRVDYWLWNRGLETRYSALPRHRTLSRFY